MTELTSLGFHGDPSAPGSCGKPMECFQYRVSIFSCACYGLIKKNNYDNKSSYINGSD